MSDRATILGAIRAATRSENTPAADITKEARELVADPAATQPDFGGASLLDRFISKATSERVTATVAQIGAIFFKC